MYVVVFISDNDSRTVSSIQIKEGIIRLDQPQHIPLADWMTQDISLLAPPKSNPASWPEGALRPLPFLSTPEWFTFVRRLAFAAKRASSTLPSRSSKLHLNSTRPLVPNSTAMTERNCDSDPSQNVLYARPESARSLNLNGTTEQSTIP